uniref:Lipid-binding serum glycoprotein N-terminal domain-containing protein n=1 Tax=Melopsittacus undulatus TaxID=13146 RepID=A0A8C6J4G0_MELUD
MLKLFGIICFCGLLSPSQEVLSGLSCAVSPGALQKVLSDAILQNGLLQQHLQGLVLPNIMGEGGLLNSPTSITGLHLVQVRLPKLSVVLLPGIGVQLSIGAKLELGGNCLVGLLSELIDVLVDVNITANIKCKNFESGTVQVVTEDCLCILGAIRIKLLSGEFSDLGCGCGVWLGAGFVLLIPWCCEDPSPHAAVIPVGTAGTIHYQLASLPFTSGSFLGLDLDGAVKQVGGSIIPHDSSPSALPPLLDKLLVLGLRQSFLNAILSLLVRIPPQTFTGTPEIFSSAGSLQKAIVTLLPTGCSACRGTSPLSIRLTLVGSPLILLEDRKATVELSVLVQVFVRRSDGSILNILLLKAVSVHGNTSNQCHAQLVGDWQLGWGHVLILHPLCLQDLSLNVHVSIAGGRLVLGVSLGR